MCVLCKFGARTAAAHVDAFSSLNWCARTQQWEARTDALVIEARTELCVPMARILGVVVRIVDPTDHVERESSS